ncbi:GlcG/HbpS family heme-binding protein [Mycobacterium avium]|uniref:GlcG protein n=1 Tax=Mycobacterium avium (strain 104) TaxID=243243 RepID=A0A0H3A338_MYCA1|nr:heme-binding protein [Mycobacterium avium]ABK68583.1 GlcG protein [Mycobacterium avium 104]KDP08960.1 GlcG protein [Mycobacterium avium subsp. hominissuis 101]MCG3242808.1 heme-binding protein [Mycobacterium avium subsp. hominissuis]
MIDLARARTIVDGALDHARGNDFPPMTIAVLDAAGRLVAFASEDGSSLLRGRIARAKARGALNMGVGSRSLAARAESHPAFVNALVALAGGDLVPVPGGVLIRDGNDDLIGAVGVSGHDPDHDEACAIQGVAAGGLRADPGN